RTFQFGPAVAGCIGNPAPAVAALAVLNVFETVDFRIRINTRGAGFCSGVGERDISRLRLGGIDFQLVNARFRVGGFCDGESDFSGAYGSEALDVEPRMNGNTQVVGIDVAGLRQRLKPG